MMVNDSWEPQSLVLLSNQQVHSCVLGPSELQLFTSLPGWKHTHKLFSSQNTEGTCVRACVNVCANAQRKLKARTWKKARSLRLVISSKPSCP